MDEIKIYKCRRKSHVDIINEEIKGSSSKEEDIGIRKSRRISRVDIITEEMIGSTCSSKQQEAPPDPTNTKEEISLEHIKRMEKSSPRMGIFGA